MGLIYIKKRKDPVIVSDKRALQLKDLWIGTDGKIKIPPDEIIDLGDWAGEARMISAIGIEKEVAPKDIAKEMSEEEELRRKVPVAEKARQLGKFKLEWYMRSGMKEKIPLPNVVEQAKRVLIEYFTAHPEALTYPSEILEPLLEDKFGKK